MKNLCNPRSLEIMMINGNMIKKDKVTARRPAKIASISP